MVGEHKFGTQNLSEGISFIGKITAAYWQQSPNFGTGSRETLVLEIKPLSYEGNNRYIYIPYSDRINSKWGKFNEMLEQSGLQFDPNTFTEQDLVNKIFEFKSFDLKFGSGENAIEVNGMLLPVRFLSEEKEADQYGQIKTQPTPQQTLPTQAPQQPVQTTTTLPEPVGTIEPDTTKDDSIAELILGYLKIKRQATFNELMTKLNVSKDRIIPILFDLSEKGKVVLEGPVVKIIGQ